MSRRAPGALAHLDGVAPARAEVHHKPLLAAVGQRHGRRRRAAREHALRQRPEPDRHALAAVAAVAGRRHYGERPRRLVRRERHVHRNAGVVRRRRVAQVRLRQRHRHRAAGRRVQFHAHRRVGAAFGRRVGHRPERHRHPPEPVVVGQRHRRRGRPGADAHPAVGVIDERQRHALAVVVVRIVGCLHRDRLRLLAHPEPHALRDARVVRRRRAHVRHHQPHNERLDFHRLAQMNRHPRGGAALRGRVGFGPERRRHPGQFLVHELDRFVRPPGARAHPRRQRAEVQPQALAGLFLAVRFRAHAEGRHALAHRERHARRDTLVVLRRRPAPVRHHQRDRHRLLRIAVRRPVPAGAQGKSEPMPHGVALAHLDGGVALRAEVHDQVRIVVDQRHRRRAAGARRVPARQRPEPELHALAAVLVRVVGRRHHERAPRLPGRERHVRRHARVVRRRGAAPVRLRQRDRHRRRCRRAQLHRHRRRGAALRGGVRGGSERDRRLARGGWTGRRRRWR